MPISAPSNTHWLPDGLFQPGSESEWKDLILKELKGLEYNSLRSKTADGIPIEPIYSREIEKSILYLSNPAWFNFLRNLNPPKLKTSQSANSVLQDQQESDYSIQDLCISITGNPESINKGLTSLKPLTLDIRSDFSEEWKNFIQQNDCTGYARWSFQQVPLSTEWPTGFSPYAFRADSYHHQGSTAVQEIAWVLHDLIQFLHQWTELGLNVADAQSLVHFRFSIGPDLFANVAKIRAFRGLYFRLMQAYGIHSPEQAVILSDASLRYYTSLDQYNNLLRAGTAAFAALVSACYSFEAHPFSNTDSSSFVNRMNRNLVRILSEESYLTQTADPLGGAWAIESLTWELMQAAEKLLQDTEAKAGDAASFKEALLSEAREKLSNDFAKGKFHLIGVNHQVSKYSVAPEPFSFEGMPRPLFRLSEPFEQMQAAAFNLPGYQFELLCPEKECQPRIDFIKQFMAVCGLYPTEVNPGLKIICGKDEDYAKPESLGKIRALAQLSPVVLAGKPASGLDLLLEAGIQETIYMGSDRIATGKKLHLLIQKF